MAIGLSNYMPSQYIILSVAHKLSVVGEVRSGLLDKGGHTFGLLSSRTISGAHRKNIVGDKLA